MTGRNVSHFCYLEEYELHNSKAMKIRLWHGQWPSGEQSSSQYNKASYMLLIIAASEWQVYWKVGADSDYGVRAFCEF